MGNNTMQEYAELFASFDDNIMFVDVNDDGTFSVAAINPAAERSFGLNSEAVRGMRKRDLFPAELATRLERYDQACVDSGETVHYEEVLDHPSGSRHYSVTHVPLKDQAGRIRRIAAISRDISERKATEDALKESEARYQQVFEHSQDGLFLFDVTEDECFRMIEANPAFERLIGISRSLMLGKCCDEILPASTARELDEKFHRCLAVGTIFEEEILLELASGSRTCLLTLVPVRDGCGKILRISGLMRDVTERRLYEQALLARAEQEKRLSSFVDSAPGFFFTLSKSPDGDMTMPFASPGITDIVGLRPEDVAHGVEMLVARYHPDDLARVQQKVAESGQNLAPCHAEFRVLNPDKGERWVEARSMPHRDDAGNTLWHGFMQDVTERKCAEQYEQFRSRILELLSGNHLLPRILEEIVLGVEQLDPSMRCSILMLDGKHLVLGAAPSLPGFYNEAIDGVEIGPGVGSCGSCAASGERVIVEDTRTHPYWVAFKELAARAGIGACWSHPVLSSSGNVLGTFAIYHREAHTPTAQDISLIEKTARMVSLAIERKQSERTLELVHNRLQGVLQTIPDLVWLKDMKGVYLSCNHAFERFFGAKEADIIGKTDYDFVDVELADFFLQKDREAIEANRICINEEWVTFAEDNRRVLLEVRKVPLRDADGKVTGVLGISQDITERKRIENALKHSEAMLQEAQRIAHVGSWDVDMVNDKLVWSDEIFRIWEIDKAQFQANFAAFLETVHPEDREHVAQAYNEAVDNHSLYEVEHRLLFPDGRIKHILERGEPQYDAQGKPVRFIGTSLDITERKQAENALQQSEMKFRTLYDSTGDAVMLLDEQGFFDCNDSALKTFGCATREAFCAKHPADLSPSVQLCGTDSRVLANLHIEKAMQDGSDRFEWIHRRADNNESFPAEVLLSSMELDGRPVLQATVRDITERKQAQQRLELLERAIDFSADTVFLIDEQLRFRYVNETACRSLGYSREELLAMGPCDIDPDMPRELALEMMKNSPVGETVNFETRHRSKDGRSYPVELSGVHFEDGGEKFGLSVVRDISERKRAEAELLDSRNFLDLVLNGISDAIAVKDRQHRWVQINDACCAMIGESREVLLGKSDYDFFPKEQADVFREKDELVFSSGEAIVNEEILTSTNGEVRYIQTKKTPFRGVDGQLLLVAASRDITEIKRTQLALQNSEREYRSLAENLPDNIARWDAQGRYLYVNPTHERTLGVTASELIGKPIPDTHEHVKAAIAQVVATGQVVELVRQLVPVNGEIQVHEVSLVPERDAAGRIVSVLGLGRNMTEYYRLQDTIAARERQFRSLAETSPDLIARFDRDCRRLYANQAMAALAEKTVEALVGAPPSDGVILAPAYAQKLMAGIREVFATGVNVRIELSTVYRDGSTHEFDALLVPEFGADARIETVLLLSRDITDRKRMEATLAASERQFRTLAENSPDPIYRYDRDCRRLYVNQACVDIVGRPAAELIGNSPDDAAIVDSEQGNKLTAAIREVFAGGAMQKIELDFVDRNGEHHDYFMLLIPERDDEGCVATVLGLARDITDIRRAERKLRHFIANVPGCVYSFRKSPDGHFSFPFVSAGIEDIYGLSPEDVQDDMGPLHVMAHPDDVRAIEDVIEESARNMTPSCHEYRVQRPGFPDKWIEARAIPEMAADGGIVWHGIMFDITLRKRLETELNQSRDFLGAVLDGIFDPIFVKDRQHRWILINDAFCALIGKPREELIGKSDYDFFPKQQADVFWEKDELVFVTGEANLNEESITTADGDTHFIQTKKASFVAGDGSLMLVGVIRDITERKQAEQQLKQALEFSEGVINAIPDLLFEVDGDGKYLNVWAQNSALLAAQKELLLGNCIHNVLAPDAAAVALEALREAKQQGISLGRVMRIDLPHGASWFELSVSRKSTCNPLEPHYLVLSRDITERIQAELALQVSEEKMRSLYELSPLGIALTDMQGRYVEFNDAFCEICGYPADELMTLDYWTLTPREYEAQEAEQLESLSRTGRYGPYEKEYRKKNGTLVPIQLNGMMVTGRDGQQYIWSIVEDISERKRTENVLGFVAGGEWLFSGEAFLDSLVRYLGRTLGVTYVIIDRLTDDRAHAESVAIYAAGEIAPNIRYPLQGVPCGEVMAGRKLSYPENLREHFPESAVLADLKAESYVGVPLRNVEGQVIGLIAVLDVAPMDDVKRILSTLQLVSSSAAAELVRNRMEADLRNSHESLCEAQRISHVGNWALDIASGALTWSDEIFRIFEVDQTKFDASYDAFLNAIHPEDRDAVNHAYLDSLERRVPYQIEHRLLFDDGRIKYVHERCETQYGEDGKPVRSIGTVQDITVRRQIEKSLRESMEKITNLNLYLEENAQRLEENARDLEDQAVELEAQTVELEASQAQLKQTEAWYRSILHSAPDGMLVFDERGLIMQVNAQLETMFGYRDGELSGCPVEVLLPQDSRERQLQRLTEFAGAQDGDAKTLSGRRKDGSTFPVDVSLSQLPALDGQRRAVCASVRDITQRHAMEAARDAALAEALRLAQLRSAFMAQMSHELRTPLNGILGYTQNLLYSAGLGEKQLAGLRIIQHSGEHLLSLINGLLDHAAIEAGKFELILGDIELDPFLTAIIGIIRVRAEQKNISFSFDADPALPAVVCGDAQRLRQVLINLLANAVKFTDSGDVTLRVRQIAPLRICFAVEDSGVGISPDQFENIFLPFEQTGETSRRAGGSGLGLAISRKLVRLMGGDILVESRLGAGSVFSFDIEMKTVQSDAQTIDAATLSALAETCRATPTSVAPPAQELEILYQLALRGSMRDVMHHADHLLESDQRYLDFVEQIRQLTRRFQTKALLALLEQYRKGN